jgi:hypothetical protein
VDSNPNLHFWNPILIRSGFNGLVDPNSATPEPEPKPGRKKLHTNKRKWRSLWRTAGLQIFIEEYEEIEIYIEILEQI